MKQKYMVVLGNDKYATTSESESDDDIPSLGDVSDGHEHPTEGKVFFMVSQQALSTQRRG